MPAGTLFVGAEGVLLIPKGRGASYASSRPLDEGLELVMAIQLGMPVGRVVVAAHCEDRQHIEFWVRMNGLKAVDAHIPPVEDFDEDPGLAQWHILERVRAQGPVWMVITAHNLVAERCVGSYQPVMLYGRRGSVGDLPETLPWDLARQRASRHRVAEAEQEQGD